MNEDRYFSKCAQAFDMLFPSECIERVYLKDVDSANRFLTTHGQVRNLFTVWECKSSSSLRRANLSESLCIWDHIVPFLANSRQRK